MSQVEDDEGDLECTICLQLPCSQIFQCRNAHLLCMDCFHENRQHCERDNRDQQCPTCRVSISGEPIRNRIAEREVARRPAKCHHCGDEVSRGDLQDHEAICPSRMVTCEAAEEGCAWTGKQQVCPHHKFTTGQKGAP